MEKSRCLRIWELAALITLCVCLTAGLWAEGRQQRIAGSLVRLHVLAASDAAEEQAVKLRVRDAVLNYLAPRLEGADSAGAAEAILAGDAELAYSSMKAHMEDLERRYWN